MSLFSYIKTFFHAGQDGVAKSARDRANAPILPLSFRRDVERMHDADATSQARDRRHEPILPLPSAPVSGVKLGA